MKSEPSARHSQTSDVFASRPALFNPLFPTQVIHSQTLHVKKVTVWVGVSPKSMPHCKSNNPVFATTKVPSHVMFKNGKID